MGNDGAAYVARNWDGLQVTVDVLANDGDPAGSLNRNAVQVEVLPPANGQQPRGTAIVNANKTITYTSGPTYDGTGDTFRYRVCDNGTPRRCATSTVTITS